MEQQARHLASTSKSRKEVTLDNNRSHGAEQQLFACPAALKADSKSPGHWRKRCTPKEPTDQPKISLFSAQDQSYCQQGFS